MLQVPSVRKVIGMNVSKIVDIFESKTESKNNGLLKLMAGRKKTPGKKSILTPVKKILKKKNTPKKKPSIS